MGPKTALHNWKNELASWCPDLKVFIYYGNMAERSELRADGTPAHIPLSALSPLARFFFFFLFY
jgi:SNF2 family DNA or RNA helicase